MRLKIKYNLRAPFHCWVFHPNSKKCSDFHPAFVGFSAPKCSDFHPHLLGFAPPRALETPEFTECIKRLTIYPIDIQFISKVFFYGMIENFGVKKRKMKEKGLTGRKIGRKSPVKQFKEFRAEFLLGFSPLLHDLKRANPINFTYIVDNHCFNYWDFHPHTASVSGNPIR